MIATARRDPPPRMAAGENTAIGTPRFDALARLTYYFSVGGVVVTRDWGRDPVYESRAVRIDARFPPVVLFDYKAPRQVADEEIQMMLDLADDHLERGATYIAVVGLRRGNGLIVARHRKMFADYFERRRRALDRDNVYAVVMTPEAIFRAAVRVVYRFRVPAMRTLTVPDAASAADAVTRELHRIGEPPTEELAKFLGWLGRTYPDLQAASA